MSAEVAALWRELQKQRAHCRAHIDREVPPELRDRCIAELERQIEPLMRGLAEAEADLAVRKAKHSPRGAA